MTALREYVWKWKDEIGWALLTFSVAVALEFIATDQAAVQDWDLDQWGVWLRASVLAGIRAVVVGFVKVAVK